jgi:hypothetical protein
VGWGWGMSGAAVLDGREQGLAKWAAE